MKFIEWLFKWIIAIMVVISMISILGHYYSIPVVHWSTSSNECVKVIVDGIETGCNELPEKYERIWVK